MRPALVTDSNSQIPDELRSRYAVTVVPISVVVDQVEYLEGVDLDADRFYALLAAGTPEVSTSQPSPGAFLDAYRSVHAAGHDEIISIHVTEAMSGTLNSARIAAGMVDAKVHLVDSRTMSFGISCCVWRAGQVLDEGGSVDDAVATAQTLAGELHSVTALGAADLLPAGGRVGITPSRSGVQIFRAAPDGRIEVIGNGKSDREVIGLMADTMHNDGAPIRVALGIADQTAMAYYEGLEGQLADRPDVVEILRYRIGPSVGAFTGLGCAGGFWFPA